MASSGVVNLFNTGKSALFANRAALATTGHNIANVNSEGYTRQIVNQSAAQPIKMGNSVYGTGVRVDSIERVADNYLIQQMNNEQKLLGYSEEGDIQLRHVEEIFNEVNGVGMNGLLNKFFNEYRKLANDPDEEAIRTSVREATKQVVGDFKRINSSLDGIRHNIDTRIEGYIKKVNEYSDSIAQLNDQINRLEVSGGNANDLLDKRDVLTKKLADMIDIKVAKGDRGNSQIILNGIGTLVSGVKANHLKVESTPEDLARGKVAGSYDIILEGATYPEITSKMKDSRLGALVEIRDTVIHGIKKKLDEMAFAVTKSVNTVHQLGCGKDGVSGRNLFKDIKDVHGASEILDLDDSIKESLNHLAAGLEPNAPSDNRVALAIAKLEDARLLNGGKTTFDEHYNAIVSDMATVANKNKTTLTHQKDIVDQLTKFRDSLSGVSLDEETTKMIQYQHAMNASSKALKVADEVLQTILSIKQ